MASDMRLNDKPIAKDGAYIYAEAADGSQVKISKADLAAVVAGILGNPLGYKTNASKNLDDYKDIGIYDIIADSSMTNQPENAWATLTVTRFMPNQSYIQQDFIAFGTSKRYVRLYNGTSWSSWS